MEYSTRDFSIQCMCNSKLKESARKKLENKNRSLVLLNDLNKIKGIMCCKNSSNT